jgi:hypothetical protein
MPQFNRQHLIRPKFEENLWIGDSFTTNNEQRIIREFNPNTGDSIDREGNPITTIARVNEIAFSEADDYILVGGRPNTGVDNPNSNTVQLMDRNGIIIWERAQTTSTTGTIGATRDSKGDCYAVGERQPSDNPIRKYSRTGALLWTYTDTVSYFDCMVDYNDDFYAVRFNATNTLRKFSPSGTLLWSRSFLVGRCGCVDIDGNIWVGSTRGSSQSVRKYDSSGNVLLTIDTGGNCNDICSDFDGNIICGVNRNSNINATESSIFKFSTTGTLLWQRNGLTGFGNGFGVAVDRDNNVYASVGTADSPINRKYSPDGTQLWSIDDTENAIQSFHGTRVLPLPLR